jgi:hypothetical protein
VGLRREVDIVANIEVLVTVTDHLNDESSELYWWM